jgi:ribosomal protein L7/L12
MSESEIQTLKLRVEALEKMMSQVCEKTGLSFEPFFNDSLITEALKNKNLIGAIKLYTEIHKTSLGDAKAAVEKLQKSLGL